MRSPSPSWLAFFLAIGLCAQPRPLCDAELKGLPPQPSRNLPEPPPPSCEGADNLVAAAANNCVAKMQELLSAGASIELTDEEGRTPLTLPVFRARAEATRLLLAAGADPTVRDGSHSLLCWGARSSEVSRVFVERDVLTNLEDECRYLATFSIRGDADVLRELIAYGLDIRKPDHHERTPLFNAILYGNYAAVQVLLEAGAEFNDEYLFQSDPTATCLLLHHGADPNVRDEQGQTSLMRAAYLGLDVRVLYLLEGGADPNLQDREGRTALMHSLTGPVQLQHSHVTVGSKAIVAEALLRHGVDLKIRDAEGRTAADYAEANGYNALARVLRRRTE